jgi:hypothetical protein|tara:strand:+ start:88 stop:375 length:288 start_codon:yes stop_codon:yes gene_type:complete
MTTWQNLSNQEKGFYAEFHAPVEGGVRYRPEDNAHLIPCQYTPSEAQINYVCYTGDRLTRTINYRMNAHQRNAVVQWIQEHLPNHPDPILPHSNL